MAMRKTLSFLKDGILLAFLSIVLTVFTACRNTQNDPAAYVNPSIDTKSPIWLYFSSACRPFGLVSLSPDTWVYGTWNSGYLYDTATIRCFRIFLNCFLKINIRLIAVSWEDPCSGYDNFSLHNRIVL